MRRGKIIGFWLKLIALCCILAIAINAAGALVRSNEDIMRNSAALQGLPRNSADVVWLGTSHMHYNIIPQLLYDDYGITSVMATGNSVDFAQSLWQLKNVLLRQSPEVVVLDVYPAAAPYCYFYVQNALAMRNEASLNTGTNPYNTASGLARWLPLGNPYKMPAIAEAFSTYGLEGEAYFELTRFHSRYSEIDRSSFLNQMGDKRLKHNFGYLYGNYTLDQSAVNVQPYSLEAAMEANEIGTFWTFTQEQLAEATLMEETVRGLKRIIEYTQRKDIRLVLCAAPYQTNAAEEKLFAQVEQLAAEHDVPFVGMDESGAKQQEYFRDLGHLNDAGARIYTDFWGGYLQEHLNLPDRRESTDARYAPWRERAGSYDEQHAAMQLNAAEGGLTSYLEQLIEVKNNHILLFTINGDVYDGFTEDDYWLMVDELGIPEEALEEWYYTGTGTLDLVLMDGELKFSAYQTEEREETIRRVIDGWEIAFEPRRWYVNGQSAGSVENGLNVSVYSMLENRLMDFRAFDLTEIYFEE